MRVPVLVIPGGSAPYIRSDIWGVLAGRVFCVDYPLPYMITPTAVPSSRDVVCYHKWMRVKLHTLAFYSEYKQTVINLQ